MYISFTESAQQSVLEASPLLTIAHGIGPDNSRRVIKFVIK